MKTALVVSGGGSKGAFAVGAIEVLRKKFDFDLVAGTSTGALIAPMVAIDDIDRLVHEYTTVRTKDILRSNWRRLWWDALYDAKPLERRIRKGMLEASGGGGASRYDRLMKSNVRILLCVVSLQSRQVCYYSQAAREPNVFAWKDFDEYVAATLGSTNQPLLMPPSRVGRDQYVDGGVREIAPISIAAAMGVRRVVAIVSSPADQPREDKDFSKILSIGGRALSLMSDETTLGDVDGALRYNKFLQVLDEVKVRAMRKFGPEKVDELFAGLDTMAGKHPLEIIIIRPDQSLPSDGLDFDPAIMQHMRELGQTAAQRALA